MSLLEQIEAVVNDMTDNNTPSQLIKVINGYTERVCDIETKNGVLKNIPCSTIASKGDEGLLVYPNGDASKPFVIIFTTNGGGGGTFLGVGAFTINNNGHLIVELPNGMSNPYTIKQDGHLYYNTSGGT